MDRLGEHERAHVKDVMDLVVLKGRVRQLAGGETAAQEALAEVQAQTG